jgi:hypothetical protein
MVKTSKSALKTVINEQAEVAITLDQKVQEAGEMIAIFILVTHTPPGRLQTPNPTLLDKRNVETPYRPPQGDSLSQRQTYGGAGLGCWKKRMLGCNGSDTG